MQQKKKGPHDHFYRARFPEFFRELPGHHVRPSAAAAFPGWLHRWEGAPSDEHGVYPYPDRYGHPTFGVGVAPSTVEAFSGYAWRVVGGGPAMPDEMREAWDALRAFGPSNPFAARHFASITKLRMPLNEALSQTSRIVAEFEAHVPKYFPNYAAWPACVQIAVMDMSYNAGPDIFASFPRFCEAMRAEDFVGASSQSDTRGTPGDRLAARRAMLAFARAWQSPGFDMDEIPNY